MVRRRVRNVQVRTRTRVTRGYTAYRRYIYYYYYWREINRLGVAGTTANTRKCAFIGTLIGRVLNLANEPEQYIRARDIQEYKNERREKILKGGRGGDDRRDGKKRRFELIYNVKLQASFNYLTEWDTALSFLLLISLGSNVNSSSRQPCTWEKIYCRSRVFRSWIAIRFAYRPLSISRDTCNDTGTTARRRVSR